MFTGLQKFSIFLIRYSEYRYQALSSYSTVSKSSGELSESAASLIYKLRNHVTRLAARISSEFRGISKIEQMEKPRCTRYIKPSVNLNLQALFEYLAGFSDSQFKWNKTKRRRRRRRTHSWHLSFVALQLIVVFGSENLSRVVLLRNFCFVMTRDTIPPVILVVILFLLLLLLLLLLLIFLLLWQDIKFVRAFMYANRSTALCFEFVFNFLFLDNCFFFFTVLLLLLTKQPTR